MAVSAPQAVDLRAQVVNISVMVGDAWSIQATITDYDLTGATVEGVLQPATGSPIALDVTVTDAANGVFTFGQDEATVTGSYDIQVTSSGGLPRTYLRGVLSVSEDVTP